MDKALFKEALARVTDNPHERALIGTLGEKTLHLVLKNYFDGDITHHEQKIGTFYADIAYMGKITEIQTRNFYPLRKKLDYFTLSYEVTVVHPIAVCKTLCWTDPQSGELVSKKKSPHKGRIYDVLKELPALKHLLGDENFKLCLLLCNMDEYRALDGYGDDRKKKATKLDKIPTELIDEMYFSDIRDYMMLLPPELPDIFVFEQFMKAVRLKRVAAHRALKMFLDIGLLTLEREEKRRKYYKIAEI